MKYTERDTQTFSKVKSTYTSLLSWPTKPLFPHLIWSIKSLKSLKSLISLVSLLILITSSITSTLHWNVLRKSSAKGSPSYWKFKNSLHSNDFLLRKIWMQKKFKMNIPLLEEKLPPQLLKWISFWIVCFFIQDRNIMTFWHSVASLYTVQLSYN